MKNLPITYFGGLELKINNYEDEYLDGLKEKELNNNKYKKRNKKINDSFALQDLLNEKQRKQILKYIGE